MPVVISIGHLLTPTTTSKQVEAEIDSLRSQLTRLTELRDQYRAEEEAGTRKP